MQWVCNRRTAEEPPPRDERDDGFLFFDFEDPDAGLGVLIKINEVQTNKLDAYICILIISLIVRVLFVFIWFRAFLKSSQYVWYRQGEYKDTLFSSSSSIWSDALSSSSLSLSSSFVGETSFVAMETLVSTVGNVKDSMTIPWLYGLRLHPCGPTGRRPEW